MRILFQGDSITDGNRIKNNTTDLNHQIGHSYVYPIVASLMCYSCDKGYECLNRGVSGNRVLDLYSRTNPIFWIWLRMFAAFLSASMILAGWFITWNPSMAKCLIFVIGTFLI